MRGRATSFGRTTGRITPARRRSLEHAASGLLIGAPHDGDLIALAPGWRFDAAAEFGRTAPLIVEVGSGDGEQAVAYAAAHPEVDVLAVEIFWEGIAGTVTRATESGVTNVRILRADASVEFGTSIPEGAADEVWTFFPDPWPKRNHHKRRLVSPRFAHAVARTLRPGGLWRLATDWPHYANQMREVLAAEPLLASHPAANPTGFSPRWEGRVRTRYERKAAAAGREVLDLTAVRC